MKLPIAEKIDIINKVTLKSLSESKQLQIVRKFTEASLGIMGADFGWAWWRNSIKDTYTIAYKSSGIPYEPNPPRKKGGNYLAQKRGEPIFVADTSKQKYEKQYDV